MRFHKNMTATPFALLAALGSIFYSAQAYADTPAATATDAAATPDETWAVHGQLTNITQSHRDFNAAYSGTNSLSPNGPTEETTDATLFLGVRPWAGAEFWLNPEADQGFGFNNTVGMAGFPSGGAYKLGNNTPYYRLPRAFLRQTISLGGDEVKVEGAANQLANTHTANNVTITAGKFAVTDIFDTNTYAHDPRGDFLNWSAIDGGAFDYAADPWGYTFGFAAEWTQDWWTLRGGYFELSQKPNDKEQNFDFRENSPMLEFEARYQLFGHPGKAKLLGYVNRADMGRYLDAVQLAQQTGTTPDIAPVRRFATRSGVVINLEQQISDDLGVFARLSKNDGSKEAYEFTDINKSFSAGMSLNGTAWGRHDDTVGVAIMVNALSNDAKTYFADGGMGVLIGDGGLSYAPEKITEAYYSWQVNKYAAVSLDYQHVDNPAYNSARGPVQIYGLRAHLQF